MTDLSVCVQLFQCRLSGRAVQHAAGLCLLHDLTLHRQRIARIDGYRRQVEPGQRQQGHDVLDRRLEVQDHLQRRIVILRQRALLDQGGRQRISQCIQFGVADALLIVDQCRSIRGATHLVGEPVGHGVERWLSAVALTGGRQVEAVRREQRIKGRRRFLQQQIKPLLQELIDGDHLARIEITALVLPPAFQL